MPPNFSVTRAVSLLWGASVFLAGGAGCWNEVLQTATRGADLDDGGSGGTEGGLSGCEGPLVQTDLPAEAQWGVPAPRKDWAFSGGEYGESEGPGVFLAARGAFRFYVNGHLLVEREASPDPVFLPLSLPPGENVLALVLAAKTGTPAAWVHVDELERSWVSDRGWKVSSAPSGDWLLPGYEDESWSDARELAGFGSGEGCEPSSGFPEDTAARWVSGNVEEGAGLALRKIVRIVPEGFGAGTTGGSQAVPLVVSTWEELNAAAVSKEDAVIVVPEGVYDFRRRGEEIEQIEVCPTVCSNDPEKSLYLVLGAEDTCANPMVTMPRDERILRVGSNKTIVGLGRGAAIRGVTFDLGSSRNVIVRNVALYDVNPALREAGDAFGLHQPEQVWIDHATTQWVSDGFTDILAGSRGITLSYIHYDGENEATCTGLHRWASEITDAEVTIHHCRYEQVSTRAPYVRGADARVHIYNNVFSNNQEWSVGARCLGQILLEGNTFENVAIATYRTDCPDVAGLGLISAPLGSNLYRDETVVHRGGDGVEPRDEVFSVPYAYNLERANRAWPLVVSRSGAGGPWALPLTR